MWLKIANHNQDKPNQRRSQLGTATRLFELSYYLLITARCDWSTIFASCFPPDLTSVTKKNSDHTKQHCCNKRSMITPEAWTPVIINSQCSSIKWIERSTKYVLPRIQVFFPFSVCFPLFLYVFLCFLLFFHVFPSFPMWSYFFLCFPIFSLVFSCFPMFSDVFLCFSYFPMFHPVFLCFPVFSYVFLCFSMFSPVSLCFHLFPYSCFPLFSRVSLCFLCFPICSPIVGFHMTSLKFKLQNYRSYWDFTFMVY